VRASDYRGLAEVQVEWLDYRELEPAAVEVEAAPAIEVRDYRAVSNPEAVLRALAAEGGLQVWAEVDAPPGVEVRSRGQLAPGPRLVAWTAPPGPHELRAALERVQPEEVYLFGRDPGLSEAKAFLERLAGLAKYALQSKQGLLPLETAATKTAQVPSAVVAGLEWLAAEGQVVILERGEEAWRLAPGEGRRDSEAAALARTRLEALLAETAAYRDYMRSAPATALVGG
jgi:hypothetical protein